MRSFTLTTLLFASITGIALAWTPSVPLSAAVIKSNNRAQLTTCFESVSENEAVTEEEIVDLYKPMDEVRLARQVTALNKLEAKWTKESAIKDYESKRLLGWTKQAEMYNGRFAMFFVVVGLLTEYWTGISFPGQIEEMLRVTGFIGLD
uniref:High light inducible protein n=1 Tax=Corethron hystrix TaxID=216773 RepID=A0A6U5HAT2_9STRA|mmetsp:Transcript_29801/g.68392  ORF Transcript_29801/g.68392 Transcript_29801/m.68392 type:complete len:149 (+) Transcript_29801:230-676(+)|eukprot:CAMPEP_0113317908 /NCGR_PEP_ID=MMETSP0010_2-20120614/12663_1 /TAXON_ID=216773 ORGANISM="Corethron hystrix, Strain 308" /NCGR_SAMPLE_ID=MMETSP0010_2 /ASSEMBLY_ACC=CAM_ASM_000155 /LENGTH=148 /DNA_ID=CAMNT_0000175053 /DNA_START=179 /DNA_END=625 /DNA_ORIENTATION=- /assembly_acc=CAM_ASM_000155